MKNCPKVNVCLLKSDWFFCLAVIAAQFMSNDTDTETSDASNGDKPYGPLKGILNQVRETAAGETVDLKTVIEAFGNRAFGPIMLLCALFVLIPFIGGLPGVPVAFGLIVILFAVQLLFRRPYPWMPKVIARIKITAAVLEKSSKVAGPWLDHIDNFVHPRLEWAVKGPMLIVVALVAILLAATMVPLGIVPFGVVVPAIIIGLLGLGITARDGLFILIGLTLSFAVPIMIFQMVL